MKKCSDCAHSNVCVWRDTFSKTADKVGDVLLGVTIYEDRCTQRFQEWVGGLAEFCGSYEECR